MRWKKMVGVAVFAGLLVACSAETSGNNGSEGGSEDALASLQKAKDELEAAKAIPSTGDLGPDIDVKSLAGRLVYSIPIDANNEFYVNSEAAMKAVAERAGLDYVTFPTDGTQTSFQQGFNQAINAKAAAILLNGPLAESLEPQIDEAAEADIPVIPLHSRDVDEPANSRTPYEAFAPFHRGARLSALAAIAEADAKRPVNALIIEASDTPPSPGMAKVLADVIEEYGVKGSKTTLVDAPLVEWSTKIQGLVQSALVRDREINAILPIFDSMATYVVAGIEQAAPGREIGVYSFNGNPAILDMVRKGRVHADAGENPDWVAHVNLDTAFRAILGVSPIPASTNPIRLFDASNVEETGVPSEVGKGFGDAYTEAYLAMWGLEE